jgi:hypothetical protein
VIQNTKLKSAVAEARAGFNQSASSLSINSGDGLNAEIHWQVSPFVRALLVRVCELSTSCGSASFCDYQAAESAVRNNNKKDARPATRISKNCHSAKQSW